MPGSGKSVASDVARQMGLSVIVMGDIIREEAERLKLEPSDENLGSVGNLLRAKDGDTAIAARTLEKARHLGKEKVIIDGLRSKAEVEFFRSKSDDFKLVEIWAPSETRTKRIQIRGRTDDSNVDGAAIVSVVKSNDKSNMAFQVLGMREVRELGWGMEEAIQEADFRINNEGEIEVFRKSVRNMLEDLISA
ncbi:MAG: AAA family ATPase [Methanotrichaceae archaeon]|nr:AAA family ATPase [Methanotrichaceae archaeon]